MFAILNHPLQATFAFSCVLILLLAPPALAGGDAVVDPGTSSIMDRARPSYVGQALDPSKQASQYVLRTWSKQEGLASSHVRAGVQSAGGYLWLATWRGLARFDGSRFVLYDQTNVPELPTNNLVALERGPRGGLWIGTAGAGILHFDGRDFHEVLEVGAIGLYDLDAMAVTPTGDVWLGTSGGLFLVREDRLVEIPGLARLAGVAIGALDVASDGSLWIGTAFKGIYRFQNGTLQMVVEAKSLGSVVVTKLLCSRQRAVWVGTARHGLFRFDGFEAPGGVRQTVFSRAQGLVDLRITSLFEDAVGSLWIGTDGGLHRFTARGLESFVTAQDGRPGDERLRDDRIRAIFGDREGHLWVGTYAGGLSRLGDGVVTTYRPPVAAAVADTRALLEDRDGRLWIGTHGLGLQHFEGDRFTTLTPDTGFPSRVVWSILHAGDGRFWLGTEDGLLEAPEGPGSLLREVPGPVVRHTVAQGLASDRIRVVFEDPAALNGVWIGTIDAGVNHYVDGQVIGHWGVAEGLPHRNVRWIHKASEAAGDLWVGTWSGLARLREGELRVYGVGDGLPGHTMRSVYEDASGTLWLGTSGFGLIRYRDGAFTAYSVREGLPYSDVWGILEDSQDHLWMSSDDGLTRVAKIDLEAFAAGRLASVPTEVFDHGDGLRTAEMSSGGFPAAWRDTNGSLWFPSMQGPAKARPELLDHRPAPSPPRIEEIHSGDLVMVPAGMLTAGEILRLPPGYRDLTIRYTVPSFAASEDLSFEYLLEGDDETWTHAGSRRVAYYTNLSAGSYRFRVRASDGSGWQGEATVDLELRPALYETRTFASVAILLGALAVGGGLRRWAARVRQRTRELEEEVARRRQAESDLARAVDDLEARHAELQARSAELESFTYTVSHDLKNPLVTIKGFLGVLRRDLDRGAHGRIEEDLGRIETAAESMERLLGELLELSRVGRVVGPEVPVPLWDLVEEVLADSAEDLHENGAVVDVTSHLPIAFGDRGRLRQVFESLIDNALRFSAAEETPRLEIGLRDDHGMPVLFVRDNGCGIDPRYHQKVFGLFEKLDASSPAAGVGLTLCKRIVELHGGRIWIESSGPGQGSTFCFTLPVDTALVSAA